MALSSSISSVNRKTAVENVPDLRHVIPKLEPRKRPRPMNPFPVPETPRLPESSATTSIDFKKPIRRILSTKDHEMFLTSPTYQLVLAFVFGLADSVTDVPISSVKDSDVSPKLQKILLILDHVRKAVERTPPRDQGDSRFGNESFRDFLDLCTKEHASWHAQLDITSPAAVEEVSTYFLQAFGNRTRIDYGSGHELNFILWLLCFYQIGIIMPGDFRALVLVVFTKYLDLMRHIQSVYYLEPAGSHGVWGLDDYQFLPFLFGSSQLLHHPFLRPFSIHQDFILEEYSQDYLYLGQINFINDVKNVKGLRWHSPMLDDISSAKSWAKVEAGMRRIFIAEVLKKLPVMQHFLFGALIPAVEDMTSEELEVENKDGAGCCDGAVRADDMKHTHVNSWGDCCGIKVPSSVGAAQQIRKKMNGRSQSLRRIPFD